MFGPRYFGARYFGPRYFGSGTSAAVVGSIARLTTLSSTADLSEYTFSSVSFGDAATGRVMLLVINSRSSGNSAVTGVTIGGVTATEIVQEGATSASTSAIYAASVPTGTSGDVVITFSGSPLRCVADVFRAVDISLSPTQTRKATSNTFSTTLDIPAGGVALGGGQGFSAGGYTWAGLTKRSDSVTELMRFTSASDAFASEQSALAITCTPDSTPTTPTYVAASFGPAGGAADTIVLPFLDSSAQLFAPTLSPGPVELALPLIGSTAQLFPPTITGSGALSLPRIESTATLFAPTLSPGPVGLTLPLLASTATLFPPTITTGTTLVLPLIGSTAQLFPPTLSPGPVGLTLPLIASTAQLFPPMLVQAGGPPQSLTLPLLASTATLYAPTIALAAIGVGPQVTGAVVSADGLELVIAFDRIVSTATPLAGWSVTADGDPVDLAAAFITDAGRSITLVPAAAILADQTVLLSYSTS